MLQQNSIMSIWEHPTQCLLLLHSVQIINEIGNYNFVRGKFYVRITIIFTFDAKQGYDKQFE
jgi:hypothetical protein